MVSRVVDMNDMLEEKAKNVAKQKKMFCCETHSLTYYGWVLLSNEGKQGKISWRCCVAKCYQ